MCAVHWKWHASHRTHTHSLTCGAAMRQTAKRRMGKQHGRPIKSSPTPSSHINHAAAAACARARCGRPGACPGRILLHPSQHPRCTRNINPHRRRYIDHDRLAARSLVSRCAEPTKPRPSRPCSPRDTAGARTCRRDWPTRVSSGHLVLVRLRRRTGSNQDAHRADKCARRLLDRVHWDMEYCSRTRHSSGHHRPTELCSANLIGKHHDTRSANHHTRAHRHNRSQSRILFVLIPIDHLCRIE